MRGHPNDLLLTTSAEALFPIKVTFMRTGSRNSAYLWGGGDTKEGCKVAKTHSGVVLVQGKQRTGISSEHVADSLLSIRK